MCNNKKETSQTYFSSLKNIIKYAKEEKYIRIEIIDKILLNFKPIKKI